MHAMYPNNSIQYIKTYILNFINILVKIKLCLNGENNKSMEQMFLKALEEQNN